MALKQNKSVGFVKLIATASFLVMAIASKGFAASEFSSHAYVNCRGPAMKNPILEVAILSDRTIIIEHSESQMLGKLDYRSRIVFEDTNRETDLGLTQVLRNKKNEEVRLTVDFDMASTGQLNGRLESKVEHLNATSLICWFDVLVGWDFVDLENKYPTKK